MEQQREEPVAFLLLTVPQPARAMGLGRSRALSYLAKNYRAGWHLSVRRTLRSFPWSVHPGQEVTRREGRLSCIRLPSIHVVCRITGLWHIPGEARLLPEM